MIEQNFKAFYLKKRGKVVELIKESIFPICPPPPFFPRTHLKTPEWKRIWNFYSSFSPECDLQNANSTKKKAWVRFIFEYKKLRYRNYDFFLFAFLFLVWKISFPEKKISKTRLSSSACKERVFSFLLVFFSSREKRSKKIFFDDAHLLKFFSQNGEIPKN